MIIQDALINTFKEHRQEHVFQYLDMLSEKEKHSLLEQASTIDFSIFSQLLETFRKNNNTCQPPSIEEIKPAGYIHHPEHGADPNSWKEAQEMGEAALRAGRVAAFTVAGGQGTRIGYDRPKGTLLVTPLKQKSLFQVFAEKIFAAQKRYETTIPWFIMTSTVNHRDTVEFFKQASFFGLEHVHFFKQGLMPAIDFNGKILLESRSRIAMNPDGHGGAVAALNTSGSIQAMEQMGIDTISYFQVDNPLVQCIDPYFIGFHLKAGSEMSSKMVLKENPDEKVGVFCLHRGKLSVIEYSDLPENCAQAFNASGNLMYACGNIAVHLLSTQFIKSLGNRLHHYQLPYHCACKKIPTIREDGTSYDPTEPNGIKFESFIFDALTFAKNPILVETLREDEFSPVKNASGPYSLDTATRDQINLWKRWIASTGTILPDNPKLAIEVDYKEFPDKESFITYWDNLEQKPELKANTYIS